MRVLKLARRRKGGASTLLWHNSSLDREWRSWGEMYRRVVEKLAEIE